MRQFVKVMKALSDPRRVMILKLLQHRSFCVCELQAALDISQSAVSKHLKILDDAGLVTFNKEGLWVNYLLTDGQASPYAATLLGNLRHWLNDEPEVSEMLKKISKISREDLCRR